MPLPPIERPPSPQENPFVPPGFSPLVMEMFGGINTLTDRAGIPDEQMAWCDGFMPIAPRRLRTLYGVGATLYNAVSAAASTVVFFGFANIGATPYCIIFLANGQVVAVNTNTAVATTVLNAGSITAPAIGSQGISQWGSQYLILVSNQTNGYWLWDGSVLFTAGGIAPGVSITNNGSGYTSNPTVVITGGHGTGASITASINTQTGLVVSASVVASGSGYLPSDSVSIGFTGGQTAGSGASIAVSATVALAHGLFSISALSVVANGSLYSNNPAIGFVSAGTGISASAFAGVTSGSITSATVNSGGTYANGSAVTVTITDTTVVATGSITLMPFGVQGTTAETYSGHVWVANGALVNFTAPGSPSNFATSAGGGNFTSTDSYLKIGYYRLFQSNGFLYLLADSSIDYISGVQTAGVPPTTTYTKQNADPTVGTPYPWSAILQGQNIMFANSVGIYALNGARASKVSQALDGVWNSVSAFGGLSLSSAHANIFDQEVWMTLFRLVDPVSGTTSNKLAMWDGGKKWWTSPQDTTLTFVGSQEINSVFTAYGTNGTIVAPLFATPSIGFTKTVQSKLWDQPGGYLNNHAVGRFWMLANYTSVTSPNIFVSLNAVGVDPSTGTIFTNTSAYTITGPTITGYFIAPPQSVGQQGVLNGMTIQTAANDMTLISAMLDAKLLSYRG